MVKERENRLEQQISSGEKAAANRRAAEMQKINAEIKSEFREKRKKYNFGSKQFLDTPYRLYVKHMKKLRGVRTKVLKEDEDWEKELRLVFKTNLG